MIVFHHNDADGRCAAAIVKRWHAKHKFQTRIHFVELDFSKPVPVEEIRPDDTVVIVDFSFKPDVMLEAQRRTLIGVVWCDHHVSAKDYGYDNLVGSRDFNPKGLSGCECTWKHFFPNEPIPDWVQLLGDYDSWRLENPDCFAFYEGLKLNDQSPEGELWETLFRNPYYKNVVIGEGRTAIR
jgi:oligoribonuclease NrnB/cAMP/cGMP phosphodiesterase (DHH superfamily)